MSQGLFGESPEISKRERTWWVEFGARVESRQHLGPDVRGTLLGRLRVASEQGAKWAFQPCIWLGLWDDAWQIEAASPPNPGVPISDREDREEDRYARWLLGYDPLRPAPAGVTPDDRAQAIYSLGRTAIRYSDTLRLLLEIAEQVADSNRMIVIHAPTEAWSRAHTWGGLESTRVNAIYALSEVAERGDEAVLKTLAQIALDAADSDRTCAMSALSGAASKGHHAALSTLARIAQDPDNSDMDRVSAIVSLDPAAALGHQLALSKCLKV